MLDGVIRGWAQGAIVGLFGMVCVLTLAPPQDTEPGGYFSAAAKTQHVVHVDEAAMERADHAMGFIAATTDADFIPREEWSDLAVTTWMPQGYPIDVRIISAWDKARGRAYILDVRSP